MRRFHFDLEKVLELRAFHERDAELELARAMAEAVGIQERLLILGRERTDVVADRFSPGQTGAELRNMENYLLRLDRTRDLLLDAAAKAELKVSQRREAYLEANREKKVLEKLKEKRFAEYRKVRASEEVKSLDEISGGSVLRMRISEGREFNT